MTAILFNIGKFAIGLYLGRSTFASSYGVAGSLIVLLVWVYYSAQIIFSAPSSLRFMRTTTAQSGFPPIMRILFPIRSIPKMPSNQALLAIRIKWRQEQLNGNEKTRS